MNKNLKQFGEMMKALRINSQMGIREVCKLTGYDPSNWSKIERGLISPPADRKVLANWGKILKVKKDDLNQFIDEAQIAQGIIPDDMIDKREMLELMPAFFRTVRNRKPSKEEIDRLIKLIKSA
ncbi:MAG: Helix-turn-helix domain protein [Candidatus Falkowbacteria bacterium GW2011_GWA2_39_24]|uniref:Helix-turn-helix domain protein n=1 Tax=Candidatus Falkowbacteria bacterium GW2011_GWA2_39_24 TaxID=1618634 RepID=A0A0G0NF12_9BACT|nr:MAG: Helix-turn-helix domain protein [Candidatus Falkowbacteria bacterium GW2011_GWA2_39_24]